MGGRGEQQNAKTEQSVGKKLYWTVTVWGRCESGVSLTWMVVQRFKVDPANYRFVGFPSFIKEYQVTW